MKNACGAQSCYHYYFKMIKRFSTLETVVSGNHDSMILQKNRFCPRFLIDSEYKVLVQL